ncbi:hypothetical protein OUZ56_030996 [Daphnia magna]|uniref:GMP synthase n=1 Tax=Daphnia magna TaxID=35525 RepID=A0ABQ9ZSX8_9CRUS|nr:hypothetical protein OUZ56_030996 [Daphnia magna]
MERWSNVPNKPSRLLKDELLFDAAAAASSGETNFFMFVVHPLVADEFLAANEILRLKETSNLQTKIK